MKTLARLIFWGEERRGVYSSSIVSCGGNGSSNPSPIISHVKVLSTLPIPMLMLLLKLKSSMAPLGESPLKCHRSMSRLLAIPIDGSVTVKFAVAAVRWLVCVLAGPSTEMGNALVPSGLLAEPSCVLRSVSTCSARGCQRVCAAQVPGDHAHSAVLPGPLRSLS